MLFVVGWVPNPRFLRLRIALLKNGDESSPLGIQNLLREEPGVKKVKCPAGSDQLLGLHPAWI
jgi:hypothetical protein